MSLSSLLQGFRATGFFGKNVDYSAVASLVVDPTLEDGTFRLPDRAARELFKPMAYGRMEMEGHVKGERWYCT